MKRMGEDADRDMAAAAPPGEVLRRLRGMITEMVSQAREEARAWQERARQTGAHGQYRSPALRALQPPRPGRPARGGPGALPPGEHAPGPHVSRCGQLQEHQRYPWPPGGRWRAARAGGHRLGARHAVFRLSGSVRRRGTGGAVRGARRIPRFGPGRGDPPGCGPLPLCAAPHHPGRRAPAARHREHRRGADRTGAERLGFGARRGPRHVRGKSQGRNRVVGHSQLAPYREP